MSIALFIAVVVVGIYCIACVKRRRESERYCREHEPRWAEDEARDREEHERALGELRALAQRAQIETKFLDKEWCTERVRLNPQALLDEERDLGPAYTRWMADPRFDELLKEIGADVKLVRDVWTAKMQAWLDARFQGKNEREAYQTLDQVRRSRAIHEQLDQDEKGRRPPA